MAFSLGKTPMEVESLNGTRKENTLAGTQPSVQGHASRTDQTENGRGALRRDVASTLGVERNGHEEERNKQSNAGRCFHDLNLSFMFQEIFEPL